MAIFENDIKILSSELDLGIQVGELIQITGGMTNQLYKITTDKGEYVIKVINPLKTSTENIKQLNFGEAEARYAKNMGLNVVCSINDKINQIENSFYIVFPWFDGKVIKKEEVDHQHYYKLGKLFADLFKIDFPTSFKKEREMRETINWQQYVGLNLEYSDVFEKNIDLIIQLDNAAVKARRELSNSLVLSHLDIKAENVMWKDTEPYLIDWETAGYINPLEELIYCSLSWLDHTKYSEESSKLEKILEGFVINGGKIKIDNINNVIDSIFYGSMLWIEFNLKRTTNNKPDTEENKKGTEQVKQMIELLHLRNEYREELKSIISKYAEINTTNTKRLQKN